MRKSWNVSLPEIITTAGQETGQGGRVVVASVVLVVTTAMSLLVLVVFMVAVVLAPMTVVVTLVITRRFSRTSHLFDAHTAQPEAYSGQRVCSFDRDITPAFGLE